MHDRMEMNEFGICFCCAFAIGILLEKCQSEHSHICTHYSDNRSLCTKNEKNEEQKKRISVSERCERPEYIHFSSSLL